MDRRNAENMVDRRIKAIGAAGVIIGVAAAVVSLFAERLGIPTIPGMSLKRQLLLVYGLGLLVVSFIVISNHKKRAAYIEVGLFILILILFMYSSVGLSLIILLLGSLLMLKRGNRFAETVLISIVVLSILRPPLTSLFLESSPESIERDADGYIPYAVHLSGRQVSIPASYFYFEDKYRDVPGITNLSVLFSPDGKIVASGGGDGVIQLWRLDGRPICKPIYTQQRSITSLSFSGDGKLIASGGGNGTIRLWGIDGNPVLKPISGHTRYITSISFSPDGKSIASSGADGMVRLWDLNGNVVGEKGPYNTAITFVSFSPDSRIIACGRADGTINIWDPNDDTDDVTFRMHNSAVTGIVFVSNGKGLVSSGSDGKIQQWRVDGSLSSKPFFKRGPVFSLDVHPDGHTIAGGFLQGIHLCDRNGNPIGGFFGDHSSSVTSVAFSPDGKILASGSSDGSVRLWDNAGNRIKRPFVGHDSYILQKNGTFRTSSYFRQPGYPLILSWFMRITGQYNAFAAELCQPVILAFVVVLCMLWLGRNYGPIHEIVLGGLFLEPTNYLVELASFDFADIFLALLFPISCILLFVVIFSPRKFWYWFFLWFGITFLISMIKMIVCIILGLICVSVTFVMFAAITTKRSWVMGYNLRSVTIRIVVVFLGMGLIYFAHTSISPGAVKLNREAMVFMCYWSPAPEIDNDLLKKISRMQELTNQNNNYSYKEYSGAHLTWAAQTTLPAITTFLPVAGNRPKPIIDPLTKKVLLLTASEVERGALLLLWHNPIPFMRVAFFHLVKDIRNPFIFSEIGRSSITYAASCTIIFLVGVFVCYKRFPLVVASLFLSYMLFAVFLSFAQFMAVRYLIPFAGFHYSMLVFGGAAILCMPGRFIKTKMIKNGTVMAYDTQRQEDTPEEGMDENAEALKGNVSNYYRWNLSVFSMERGKNILDIGCGPGLYFDEVMAYSPKLYMATDNSENYIQVVKQISKERSNCRTAALDLTANSIPDAITKQSFDYAICLDVLEHVEDDKKALMNIRNIMMLTGTRKLFLRVPALQCIYGTNDEAIGHFRRYSKEHLKKLLSECSFNIEKLRYQNLLGIVPWFVIGRLIKRSLAVSSDEGKIFNLIVGPLSVIERIIPPPLGLSLYCICNPKKVKVIN